MIDQIFILRRKSQTSNKFTIHREYRIGLLVLVTINDNCRKMKARIGKKCWKLNISVKVETKMMVYKRVIRPTVTYTGEIWALNKKEYT